MKANDVAQVAAKVLYVESNVIDLDKSLFADYGMSSMDFVDFAFELKTVSKKDFTPDDLWPINSMVTNPKYFSQNKWTEEGIGELQTILSGDKALQGETSVQDLYKLFTANFVERRLNAL
jgi:acyl carrier protein